MSEPTADNPRLFAPHSVSEILQLKRRYPEARIVSGGTSIVALAPPDRHIISTHRISDMQRIARSQDRLDIGTAVSIARVLADTGNILPAVLVDALKRMVAVGVRSIATLGGTLCARAVASPLAACLAALDTRIELRGIRESRRIILGRLLNDWDNIGQNTLLYRIRMPIFHWTHQTLTTLGDIHAADDQPVAFCGIARVEKQTTVDLRIAICLHGSILLRSREVESQIIALESPLEPRTVGDMFVGLQKNAEFIGRRLQPIEAQRMIRLVRAFFRSMSRQ